MAQKRQAIISEEFVREALDAVKSGSGDDYDLKSIIQWFCWSTKAGYGASPILQQIVAVLIERAMKNDKKFDDAFGLKKERQRGRKVEWSYHRKALLIVEIERIVNTRTKKTSIVNAAKIVSRQEPWATLMRENDDPAGTLKKQRDNFLREFKDNDGFKTTLDNLRVFSDDPEDWGNLVKALFNFGKNNNSN